PYVISRALIDEGRNHLLLADSVNLSCPVRLIHGMRDADVPWRTSERLADQLAAPDVVLTLVKDGDHRLSRPQDLDRMVAVVAGLLDQLEG
ncbi:MAG: alpha/beta hydrolase, partial [Alphaproteobacteria bacterium]|nr:alpha/beta hydrolase [Alphaproteobacteria bacterium]